jgi:hypothetical protein
MKAVNASKSTPDTAMDALCFKARADWLALGQAGGERGWCVGVWVRGGGRRGGGGSQEVKRGGQEGACKPGGRQGVSK